MDWGNVYTCSARGRPSPLFSDDRVVEEYLLKCSTESVLSTGDIGVRSRWLMRGLVLEKLSCVALLVVALAEFELSLRVRDAHSKLSGA